MADLSKEDIQALGRAVGLDIQEPELTEVMYSLNALLESLDAINPPAWKRWNPSRLSCLRPRAAVFPRYP